MNRVVPILVLLLFLPPTQGDANLNQHTDISLTAQQLWEFLNQTPTYDQVDVLRYWEEPVVNKTWKTNQHVTAWVDIVGYRNMFKYNGTMYYCGWPKEVIDVRYEVDHTIKGEQWWNYNVDTILPEIDSIEMNDGTATVTLRVYMKYHKSTKVTNPNTGKSRIKKKYFHEIVYFTAVDHNAPVRYWMPDVNRTYVNVTYYCNDINPHLDIFVHLPPGAVGYKLQAGTEQVVYYDHLFIKNYTAKHYPYMESVDRHTFEPEQNQYLKPVYDHTTIQGNNSTVSTLRCEVILPTYSVMVPGDRYFVNYIYFSPLMLINKDMLTRVGHLFLPLCLMFMLYRYFRTAVCSVYN